jgi:RNA polymerase subunit RPABC4/transcription elongation factor Spt4
MKKPNFKIKTASQLLLSGNVPLVRNQRTGNVSQRDFIALTLKALKVHVQDVSIGINDLDVKFGFETIFDAGIEKDICYCANCGFANKIDNENELCPICENDTFFVDKFSGRCGEGRECFDCFTTFENELDDCPKCLSDNISGISAGCGKPFYSTEKKPTIKQFARATFEIEETWQDSGRELTNTEKAINRYSDAIEKFESLTCKCFASEISEYRAGKRAEKVFNQSFRECFDCQNCFDVSLNVCPNCKGEKSVIRSKNEKHHSPDYVSKLQSIERANSKTRLIEVLNYLASHKLDRATFRSLKQETFHLAKFLGITDLQAFEKLVVKRDAMPEQHNIVYVATKQTMLNTGKDARATEKASGKDTYEYKIKSDKVGGKWNHNPIVEKVRKNRI